MSVHEFIMKGSLMAASVTPILNVIFLSFRTFCRSNGDRTLRSKIERQFNLVKGNPATRDHGGGYNEKQGEDYVDECDNPAAFL